MHLSAMSCLVFAISTVDTTLKFAASWSSGDVDLEMLTPMRNLECSCAKWSGGICD